MSVEVLTVIISAVGLLVTLGGGMFASFAWMLKRFDSLEEKLGARIDRVEVKVDALALEVTEVKVAVARLEGPERRFYAAAR